MRKINISQVSETEQHSPKGRFAVFRKHISIALGGLKDVGVFGGFDEANAPSRYYAIVEHGICRVSGRRIRN